jgi:TRAP-type C4-dicarboxylate transport system permease small subunit
MKRYKWFVDWLECIELWISALLLGGLMLIVLAEVASRYLFNRPFPWALELSILIITYVVFIGVPPLYKGRSLVILEFIFKLLPLKAQEILSFLWEILVGIFFTYLMVASYEFFSVQLRYKSPGLDIPYAYFTLPLFFCSISMLIFNIYFILGHLDTFLKKRRGT